MGLEQSVEDRVEAQMQDLIQEYTDSGNKDRFRDKLLSLITSIDRKKLDRVRTAVLLKKEEKIMEGRTWEVVYRILEKWFEQHSEDETAIAIGASQSERAPELRF